MDILITGATGTLGKEIIKQLIDTGQINVITTKADVSFAEGVNVIKADITDFKSLQTIVGAADIIVHCASNPADAKRVDLEGTRNILAAINKKRFKHFIYVSIAGVDKSQYPYYVVKREVEKIIEAEGIPFTVLRATQFHDFVLYRMIKPFDNEQGLTIPAGLKFQSIDVTEVAGKVRHLIEAGPNNEIITIGGPEILTIEEMASVYLNILGRADSFKTQMMPGERFEMLRSGINLCGDNRFGKITWRQYLKNNDQF